MVGRWRGQRENVPNVEPTTQPLTRACQQQQHSQAIHPQSTNDTGDDGDCYYEDEERKNNNNNNNNDNNNNDNNDNNNNNTGEQQQLLAGSFYGTNIIPLKHYL